MRNKEFTPNAKVYQYIILNTLEKPDLKMAEKYLTEMTRQHVQPTITILHGFMKAYTAANGRCSSWRNEFQINVLLFFMIWQSQIMKNRSTLIWNSFHNVQQTLTKHGITLRNWRNIPSNRTGTHTIFCYTCTTKRVTFKVLWNFLMKYSLPRYCYLQWKRTMKFWTF